MRNLTDQTRDAIKKSLTDNPGAVLDYVAQEHDVSAADIIQCLPDHEAKVVPGNLFEEIMLEMSSWGEITFLVHTPDVILECKGAIPKGKSARGFYNLHGAPIGGHLKAENCTSIAFVSRPLFSSQTMSVQFFNQSGDCMFKVYLGRDKKRNLLPDQIEKFKSLCEKLSLSQ